MAAEMDNPNFLDLACLFQIQPGTTLERFGSTINAGIFDSAKISGDLKLKGLVDFTADYPGPNSIIVTDAGNKLKDDADAKSSEPADALDDEILRHMSGGKRYPTELAGTLNLRSSDLAFRLWKLYRQGLLSYELKNGTVELMLTEQGFLRAKSGKMIQAPGPQTGMPTQPMQAKPAQAQKPQIKTQAQQTQEEQTQEQTPQEEIKLHGKPHTKEILLVVIIIIAAVAIAHFYLKII